MMCAHIDLLPLTALFPHRQDESHLWQDLITFAQSIWRRHLRDEISGEHLRDEISGDLGLAGGAVKKRPGL